MRRAMLIASALILLAVPARAASLFDALVQPYVASGAFSGAVLVVKDGNIVFDRAFGYADAERRLPNQVSTRFHVGTLSMTYTAAVVLRLVDIHRINLDNTAGQFVPGLDAGQGGLSIEELLAVKPDAPNASASYMLLARIAAAASGKPFADTADDTVFASVLLTGSGIDDGALDADRRMAKGYLKDGSLAQRPDWASLTGAASAYTTTRGAYHWLDRVFGGGLLSPESRDRLLAGPLSKVSFRGPQSSLEGYEALGSAPGFVSYVLWLPKVTVVVLANVETGQAKDIGGQLAMTALNDTSAVP